MAMHTLLNWYKCTENLSWSVTLASYSLQLDCVIWRKQLMGVFGIVMCIVTSEIRNRAYLKWSKLKAHARRSLEQNHPAQRKYGLVGPMIRLLVANIVDMHTTLILYN